MIFIDNCVAEAALIGITIDSERFNPGPLWMSFRLIKDFNSKDIWKLLFNAVQSEHSTTTGVTAAKLQNSVISNSPTTNVVIAAFTMAQARLELFKYLHTLRPRALYYDTDLVYFSREASGEHDLLTCMALGELTDELASNGSGMYITSFLSGGPKFYAYKLRKPGGVEEYVCKVKSIRLNYSNSLQINFETVREIITSPDSEILLSNFAI